MTLIVTTTYCYTVEPRYPDKNIQRYIDFDKDVFTSPDATIPEIVKEIKEKQTEISSDQESESDMELEQNKLPTKT